MTTKLQKQSKLHTHAPLENLTKPSLETEAAAYYLNRAEQTLRYWACSETGPIRPIRINGRLHWLVADIRGLLVMSDA